MNIISFAWTTAQLLEGKKTVTRREWSDDYAKRFKIGDRVCAYNKNPRNGGKKVAVIRITSIYKEWLHDMPESDVEAEGGRWENRKAFIEAQGGDQEMWVIRFQVLSPPLRYNL